MIASQVFPSAAQAQIKKALCRLLGHRARFSYDDLLGLFSYECVSRSDGELSANLT